MVSSGVSKSSKNTYSRDPAELDGSLGYITVHELQNAYVEWMRRLDRDIWPKGSGAHRDEIIQFFESFRLRLLTRASARVPEPKPILRSPQSNPTGIEDTDRAQYEARKARLSQYHTTK